MTVAVARLGMSRNRQREIVKGDRRSSSGKSWDGRRIGRDRIAYSLVVRACGSRDYKNAIGRPVEAALRVAALIRFPCSRALDRGEP